MEARVPEAVRIPPEVSQRWRLLLRRTADTSTKYQLTEHRSTARRVRVRTISIRGRTTACTTMERVHSPFLLTNGGGDRQNDAAFCAAMPQTVVTVHTTLRSLMRATRDTRSDENSRGPDHHNRHETAAASS